MSNTTTTAVQAEQKTHWILSTTMQFDIWCGATCHTFLRYVLRSLLILTLIGTFTTIVLRPLNPKRRAELKRRSVLDSASSLLRKSEFESVAGTFRDAGMGAKTEKRTTEQNGPDVKDPCTVM
jgi:hypothetical protein